MPDAPRTRAGRTLRLRRAQTGSGTLPLVLVLLMALALLLLHSQRALVFEQRSVANQVRAARAAEAAEAGLAWARAGLNRSGPIDDDCGSDPSAGSTGRSLRERWLRTDPDSGLAMPVAGASAACVRDDNSWRCACAPESQAALTIAADADEHPAFLVRLQPGPATPGAAPSSQVVVTGCSHVGDGCGGSGRADARAEVHTLVSPYGQLTQAPAATVTAAGPVTVASGAWIVNTSADGSGLTVRSGRTVAVDAAARLVGPAGRPPAATLDEGHGGSTSADALWRLHFGTSAATLRDLPTTHRVRCSAGSCSEADVQAAIDAGHRTLWLEGNLHLASPVRWRSAEHGLALLIDGDASWQGALEIDALVVARSLAWQGPPSGIARLRGALISLGPVTLRGAVELVHDVDVLARARDAGGVLVDVPGSWQDFVNR